MAVVSANRDASVPTNSPVADISGSGNREGEVRRIGAPTARICGNRESSLRDIFKCPALPTNATWCGVPPVFHRCGATKPKPGEARSKPKNGSQIVPQPAGAGAGAAVPGERPTLGQIKKRYGGFSDHVHQSLLVGGSVVMLATRAALKGCTTRLPSFLVAPPPLVMFLLGRSHLGMQTPPPPSASFTIFCPVFLLVDFYFPGF